MIALLSLLAVLVPPAASADGFEACKAAAGYQPCAGVFGPVTTVCYDHNINPAFCWLDGCEVVFTPTACNGFKQNAHDLCRTGDIVTENGCDKAVSPL